MKKLVILLVPILLLVGCSMANTPTSKVEDLFSKYQKNDNDIASGITSVLDEQNLSDARRDRYKKLIENQYQNLTYEIKDEIVDGNTATVIAEIEVVDYKKAIGDLTFDSSVYSKDTYDEEKLNRLEAATDKVKYTIEFTLTKDDDGNWKLNALTNEQLKKIQGTY